METTYIVGAGGIGCAVGYALCAAGAAVTFVETDARKVRWGAANGVQVDRMPPCPASFVRFADWTPAAHSTVFLCTKCYDNAAVLDRLAATDNHLTLIPIQNGFDAALERSKFGWEGIASFVSECAPEKAHTQITRGGRLHLGRRHCLDHGNSSAAPNIFTQLRLGVGALRRVRLKPAADILPYKYTKLMYNAAISPLAAAAGLDNGQLLGVRKARDLFFALLRENHSILKAAGVPLGKIGPFHPDTVRGILSRPWLAHAMAWAFYPSLRHTYCSMSGDLPNGITEIDNYNGHLIELAADTPCPLNRRVYQLVKKMERERLAPGLQVLDDLR